MTGAATLRFSKMHGAGNDFVVLDLRGGRPAPTPALAAALGDRHRGIGFDQLLTVEDPTDAAAMACYRIWNTDGSPARQCGNGARCVAAWLRRDGAATGARFALQGPSGPVGIEDRGQGHFAVDMGAPRFEPAALPFLAPPGAEGGHYSLDLDGRPVAFGVVSMGNPHAVIEVADLDVADVAGLGPALQARPEFPEGVNVGFAQVLANDRVRLRVYERGAGETLACGSGACAAAVVLARRGRTGERVQIELPGGTLEVSWAGEGSPVILAGPTAFVFEGEFELEQAA